MCLAGHPRVIRTGTLASATVGVDLGTHTRCGETGATGDASSALGSAGGLNWPIQINETRNVIKIL